MTAINLLRLLLPTILILFNACNNSKKTGTSLEADVLPKRGAFYEQLIYADNEEKDTLIYFKIDLLTRKWDFQAHKDINIGVELSTEEITHEGYPGSLYIWHSYFNNVRGKSDTLFRTNSATPKGLSVVLGKDRKSTNTPTITEIVTYKSFSTANSSISVSFPQSFHVWDSVNYKGSAENVFDNIGMMDDIILNLKNDLKNCVPQVKKVVLKTIMSDSDDVIILRKIYLL